MFSTMKMQRYRISAKRRPHSPDCGGVGRWRKGRRSCLTAVRIRPTASSAANGCAASPHRGNHAETVSFASPRSSCALFFTLSMPLMAHLLGSSGDATDDRDMQAEGKKDQAAGNLKQAGEKVKDAFKSRVEAGRLYGATGASAGLRRGRRIHEPATHTDTPRPRAAAW